MLTWIENNIGTICVTLILTVIVALIVIRLIKDKKSGKTSCGCGCEHCTMQCHKKQ